MTTHAHAHAHAHAHTHTHTDLAGGAELHLPPDEELHVAYRGFSRHPDVAPLQRLGDETMPGAQLLGLILSPFKVANSQLRSILFGYINTRP